MAGGLESIRAEIAKKYIDDDVVAFYDAVTLPITSAAIEAAVAATYEKLTNDANLHGMADKRVVIFKFFGDLKMPITTLLEHVQIAYAIPWRVHGLVAKVVKPMFCELDLGEAKDLPQRFKDTPLFLAEEVYAARENACRSARVGIDPLTKSGIAIKEHLGHRESSIFAICPDIRIELAFYSSMVGEPGQFRLEKLFLETMPTAAKPISVAATVLLLQQLFVGDLYGFCGVDVQGAVKSVQNSIHAVAEGRDPHMHAR